MSVHFINTTTLRSINSATCEHFHVSDYLVGVGFRANFLMLTYGDRSCLVRINRYFEAVASQHYCNVVIRGLVSWTMHIDAAAARPIAVHRADRCGFSRDEALAISVVATAQHGERDDAVMLLSDLLGGPACRGVVDATMTFSRILDMAGLSLSTRNAILPAGVTRP